MSELDLGSDVIVVSFLVAVLIVLLISDVRRRRWKGRRRYQRPRRQYAMEFDQRRQVAAVDQLTAVMTASFEKRRIMSLPEYRAFKIIEEEIAAARLGHRVFAQTSLGEILKSPNEDAFLSINSKRVDILVIDRAGWPVLAIEFQGDGHYQGTAAARDAVKKEALRKAGVRFLELFHETTDEQIRVRLHEHLGWPARNERGAPACID